MDLENKLKSENKSLHVSLQGIKDFCADCWKKPLLPWFTNHDQTHSEEVVRILGKLLAPFEHHLDFLDEQEIFVLLAAAYLHDIGMQYLKVEDIAIDSLTQNEYNLIRKRHAEESFNIIRKSVEKSIARDDFHLPRIDEAYLPSIAFVSKGHSTDFFDEVIDKFRTRPETPKGKRLRGELLTALLMIADELHLQNNRVEFFETAKFKLSSYSSLHWYKHHYVECMDIKNNSITITLKFPKDAEEYSGLFKELIEIKLKEQLAKVNPVLRDASKGTLHLSPEIIFVIQIDDFGTKRPLPQEVFVELKKELKREATEISTSLPSLTTYPKPSSIFTGMAEEIKKFQELLGKVNFISIEGAGGFGKTEFAAKCIDEFIQKDKVVWFDCLPESKLDSLIGLAGYADVLKGENKTELAKYSGFTDLIERDEKVLFLDNFHDIADPSFKELFKFSERRINKAKIILISREHPNAGVRVASVDIKGLKDAAVDFANKLKETFYNEATISDIELKDICKKLDGHPLAIELALQLISYGESAINIVNKIVEAEDKSADLSHRLLDEIFNHPKSTVQEKKVMLLSSVFRGDVDKNAISYLLDGEDADATLRRLFDKKMLERSGDRLSTHPLVREFCYKRLGNKKEAHLKASEYLRTLRTDKFNPLREEEIAHHLSSGESFESLADLISEKGEEFILTGNTNFLKEMIDKVVGKGIERPIFYVFCGDIATIKGEWNEATAYYDKAFSFPGATKVIAEAYIKYGEILYRKGNVKESLSYFESAVEMCKKNGWKKEEARGINDIGLVYQVFGDLPFAESKINEALAIAKEIGNKQGIATTLNNIAKVLHAKGDFNGALETNNESLAIRKELGDKLGIAMSLSNFGRVLHIKGDLDGALEMYNKSLAIEKEIGDKLGIAASLCFIGNILQDKSDLNNALEGYKESLAIVKEIGNKQGIATTLSNIGNVLHAKGDLNGALEKHKESLIIEKEIGIKRGIASSLDSIGNTLHAKGDLDGALEKHRESLAIKEKIGNKVGLATSLHNIGTIFFDKKIYSLSLKNLLESIAWRAQMEIPDADTREYISRIRKNVGLNEFKKLVSEAFDGLPEDLKPFIKLEDYTSDTTVHRDTPKIGRNDPCPCGSGKKYKKCCGK